MECEIVRGLRDELEEARRKNEATKKDLEEILEDRIEAIGGRSITTAKLASVEIVLGNVRSELEHVTKERDAYKSLHVPQEVADLCERFRNVSRELEKVTKERDEAIKQRDHQREMTLIATRNCTEANEERNVMKNALEEAIRERDDIREEIARRNEEKPGNVSILDWNNLVSDFNGWKSSIASRLDGPTGVEKRIVSAMNEMLRISEDCARYAKEVFDRLAKLEARVSKKRVRK